MPMMTRLSLGAVGLLLTVSIDARSERVNSGALCNPLDDAGCFEVVVCENTLGCGGGPQLCAEVENVVVAGEAGPGYMCTQGG
jgi:hypothetical protein